MKNFKLQKNQKLSTKNISNITKLKFSYHNYKNLTNEQYLLHSLKLLGVTQADYFKETKLQFNDEFFGKSQSASATKQFFFIVMTCLKYLCSDEQFKTVKIWYPPITVNEQLQFKKALYSVIGKIELRNKVPKNLLISKNFLMADTPTSKILQFLRILSELALRCDFLDKFSKKQRLVDICLFEVQNSQKLPNDINRFYTYPFTPGQTVINPPLDQLEIQSLKKIYKSYIDLYRKKILALSTKYSKQERISCQQLMASLVEQKQRNQKLSKKIPQSVFSDWRAFDRRKLIDKSKYVWQRLNKISCFYIEKSEVQPILKLQGEIDKVLLRWQTPSGINKMLDILKMTEKVKNLKQQCTKTIKQFDQFCRDLNNQLKKYN